MYQPDLKGRGCYPSEYYESALIDLVQNLKEQLDLLRKAITYNQLKESRNQLKTISTSSLRLLQAAAVKHVKKPTAVFCD